MFQISRVVLVALAPLALTAAAFAEPGDDPPAKKFGDFNKLVKGAKEVDGLFKLYQKDDHVYMEIMPHQFDKPLLSPIAIARGLGTGGTTLNCDEQWVLMFQPRRRQGPPDSPQRPLQGQDRHARRPGSRDHLHRFGADGSAYPVHQPDEQRSST